MVLSFKFELSESILKQLIKHLFHTFWLLFCFKSKYGCPLSSKITKLYSISNIILLPRGLKIIYNSVPLLNYPFKCLWYVLKDTQYYHLFELNYTSCYHDGMQDIMMLIRILQDELGTDFRGVFYLLKMTWCVSFLYDHWYTLLKSNVTCGPWSWIPGMWFTLCKFRLSISYAMAWEFA